MQGTRVIQADQPARTLDPGTPVVKVVPPHLVEPYLAGQRSVIAGYLYRVQDCTFTGPAGYYQALGLGYEGSDFSPGMPELYVMRWAALDMSSALMPPPASGYAPPSTIPEFFTLPVPIPVGAEVHRITPGGEEFVARYDGQVWLRPLRGL
jgi:hypothetical protein